MTPDAELLINDEGDARFHLLLLEYRAASTIYGLAWAREALHAKRLHLDAAVAAVAHAAVAAIPLPEEDPDVAALRQTEPFRKLWLEEVPRVQDQNRQLELAVTRLLVERMSAGQRVEDDEDTARRHMYIDCIAAIERVRYSLAADYDPNAAAARAAREEHWASIDPRREGAGRRGLPTAPLGSLSGRTFVVM